MPPLASTLARSLLLGLLGVTVFGACGDDRRRGGGSGYYDQADVLGVGAECSSDSQCYQERDGGIQQTCLRQFKGGYCGVQDCSSDLDCPRDSACVAHDDGSNYCFRTCVDKIDCNRNRSLDFESNCSSNVTFVSGAKGSKACVPPSG